MAKATADARWDRRGSWTSPCAGFGVAQVPVSGRGGYGSRVAWPLDWRSSCSRPRLRWPVLLPFSRGGSLAAAMTAAAAIHSTEWSAARATGIRVRSKTGAWRAASRWSRSSSMRATRTPSVVKRRRHGAARRQQQLVDRLADGCDLKAPWQSTSGPDGFTVPERRRQHPDRRGSQSESSNAACSDLSRRPGWRRWLTGPKSSAES